MLLYFFVCLFPASEFLPGITQNGPMLKSLICPMCHLTDIEHVQVHSKFKFKIHGCYNMVMLYLKVAQLY